MGAEPELALYALPFGAIACFEKILLTGSELRSKSSRANLHAVFFKPSTCRMQAMQWCWKLRERKEMYCVCPGSRGRLPKHEAAANGKGESRRRLQRSARPRPVQTNIQSEMLRVLRQRLEVDRYVL